MIQATKKSFFFLLLLVTSVVSAQNNAISFDGVEDAISIDYSAPFPVLGTFEIWFNADVYDDNHGIVDSDLGNIASGFRIESNAAGDVYLVIDDETDPPTIYNFFTGAAIGVNTWAHLAFTWSTTTGSLIGYLNGAEVFNVSHTGWPASIPDLDLGASFNTDATRKWEGRLDEMRYWDVVRDPVELANTYNQRVQPFEPGLVMYYDFTNGIGEGTFSDSGFSGTLGFPLPDELNGPFVVTSGPAIDPIPAPLVNIGELNVTDIFETDLIVTLPFSDNGTLNYVIVTSPEVPTAAQIIAGTDGNDISAPSFGSGSVTGNFFSEQLGSGFLGANDNPLVPATNYFLHLIVDDGGSVSDVASYEFSTLSGNVLANEDFEGLPTGPFIGSTPVFLNGDEWVVEQAFRDNQFPFAGAFALGLDAQSAGASFTTPGIDGSGEISFYYAAQSTAEFTIRKSVNGGSFNLLQTILVENNDYTQYTLQINEPGNTVQFLITANEIASTGELYIDNFSFTELPTPEATFTTLPVSGGSVNAGQQDVLIYKLRMDVATAATTTQGFYVELENGPYVPGDFAAGGFQLFANVGSDVQGAPVGAAASFEEIIANAFGQLFTETYNPGDQVYFYFTVDIAAGATDGNQFQVSTPVADNFGLEGSTNKIVGGLTTGPVFTILGSPPSNNALSFDGVDDYVNLGDVVEGQTELTYEAWVFYTETNAVFNEIFSKQFVSSWGIDPADKMWFHVGDGVNWLGTGVASTSAIPKNVWTHLAVTWDGATANMYINGALDHTEAHAGPMGVNANLRGIGSYGDVLVNPFEGSIDELRAWNAVRTKQQIVADAYTTLATGPSLLASYDFNVGVPGSDNSGATTLPDLTASAFDGTLQGPFDLIGTSSNWIASTAFDADVFPPTILSATTLDTDLNGQIDLITVQFSEDLDAATVTDPAGEFAIGGGYTISGTALNGTNTIDLTLTESGNPDTDQTPLLTLNTSTLTDLNGVSNVTESITPVDGAGPAMISIGTFDNDFDGQIDGINIVLSENSDIDDEGFGGTLNTAGGDVTVAGRVTTFAFAPMPAGNAFSVSFDESGVVDTEVLPVVTLLAGAVEDFNGNSIDSDQTLTAVDEAPPAVIPGTLAVSSFTADGFVIDLEVSETAPQIAYSVLESPSSAPVLDDIGTVGIASGIFSAPTALTLVSETISGLSVATTYDIYIVPYDGLSNRLVSPAILTETVSASASSFIFKFVSTDDDQFIVPTDLTTFPSGYNYTISYFDETVDPTTAIATLSNQIGDVTLTSLAQGNTYRVEIFGDFPAVFFNGLGDADEVVSIDQWGNIAWQSMNSAFEGCSQMVYNATDVPDLTLVTDMSAIFAGATAFDGNIGLWNVSNVTDFSLAFSGASAFNQDISGWNTASATLMNSMFNSATSFDQDISGWTVSNVTQMNGMFNTAEQFNQPLNSWDVTLVQEMRFMFANAIAFNQPLNLWQTDACTTFFRMFDGASSYDQDLGSFNVTNVTGSDLNRMLDNTNLSIANYDATLNGWSGQAVQTGVTFSALGLNYSSAGQVGRNILTSAPSLWTITGDALFTVVQSVADGNWSDPATWSGGVVPADGANIDIQNNVIVDITDANVGDFLLSTGTIDLNGNNLNVAGNYNAIGAGFTSNGGTVKLDGVNQSFSNTGDITFDNLEFSSTGILTIETLSGGNFVNIQNSLLIGAGTSVSFNEFGALRLNGTASFNNQGTITSSFKWDVFFAGTSHVITGGDFHNVAWSGSANVILGGDFNFDNTFQSSENGNTFDIGSFEVNLGRDWIFSSIDAFQFATGGRFFTDEAADPINFSMAVNKVPTMTVAMSGSASLDFSEATVFDTDQQLIIQGGTVGMFNTTFSGAAGGISLTGGTLSLFESNLIFNNDASLTNNGGVVDIVGNLASEGAPFSISSDNATSYTISQLSGSMNLAQGIISNLGGAGISVSGGDLNLDLVNFNDGVGTSYLFFATDIGPKTYADISFFTGPSTNVSIIDGVFQTIDFTNFSGDFGGPDFDSPGTTGLINWTGPSLSGVYVTSDFSEINKVPLAGGAFESVFLTGATDFGIDIDRRSGFIYWISDDGFDTAIKSIDAVGGAPSASTIFSLGEAGTPFGALAIDTSNLVSEEILVVRQTDDNILRIVDGTLTGAFDLVGTGINDLEIYDGIAYWTSTANGGEIWSAPTDDLGTASVVVTNAGDNIYGLAIDPEEGKMYWSVQATGFINRADLTGPTSEVFISGQGPTIEDVEINYETRELIFLRNDSGTALAVALSDGTSTGTLFTDNERDYAYLHVSSVYTPANQVPVLSDLVTFPETNDVTVDISVDVLSDLYFVISESASVPTANQVFSGLDGDGAVAVDAGSFGGIQNSANFTVGNGILLEGTTYTTHWVAEVGGQFSNVLSQTFTTNVPTNVTYVTQPVSPVDLPLGSLENLVYAFSLLSDQDQNFEGVVVEFENNGFDPALDLNGLTPVTLWTSTSSDFGAATPVGSFGFGADIGGRVLTAFESGLLFSTVIPTGVETFFFVTVDVSPSATPGRLIKVIAGDLSNDVGLDDAIVSGSYDEGPFFTIVTPTADPDATFTTLEALGGPVLAGSTNNLVYKFSIEASGGNITKQGMSVAIGGDAVASDFATDGWKLYESVNTDVVDPLNATQIGATNIGVAIPDSVGFLMSGDILDGDTHFYYLTVDVDPAAQVGKTFNVVLHTPDPLEGVGLADPKNKINAGFVDGEFFTIDAGAPVVFPGNALQFDGLSSEVVLASPVQEAWSDFTIEMWMNVPSSSSGQFDYFEQVDQNGGGQPQIILASILNGAPYFFVRETSSITDGGLAEANTFINDDTWHHVAYVKSGSDYNIYIDGILDRTVTGSGTGVITFPPTGVVASLRGDAALDEVKIWGFAKSDFSDRYVEASGLETDLLAYYNLDEGIGSIAADKSPAAIDGNLSGFSFSPGSDWITSGPFPADVTAPTVAIDLLVTNVSSPALTGQVDDPSALIDVEIETITYPAVNNGDGTWQLDAGTINPLADGVYDVLVTATDPFSNQGTDSSNGELTIDTVLPVVAAILRVAPETTNATAVDFEVTFPEEVSGVEIGDFLIGTTGTATGTLDAVSTSDNITYQVSVIGISGNGTISISFDAGNSGGVTDLAGNISSANFTTGESYTIDNTGVSVSILRKAPLEEFTAVGNLLFDLQFSEPVNNFDVGDLNLTGTATAVISTLTATGASTYDLAVAVTLEGTVSVGFDAAQDIEDLSANPFAEVISLQEDYTVDQTPPSVLIGTSETSPTNSSVLPITITLSEAVNTFVIGDLSIINGTASNFNGSGTDFTVDVTPLADGQVSVSIDAGVLSDEAGNISDASNILNVESDQTAPVVTVDALVTSELSPEITGTVDDPNATVEVFVDGLSYSATVDVGGIWNVASGTIAALAEGTFEVIATATDPAGNTSNDATSNELLVDTTSPVVTVTSLLSNNRSPELSGTVDDVAAVVEIQLAGSSYTAVNNGDNSWTLTAGSISPELADGVYDVEVTATDAVGNTAGDATTDELTIDATAPIIEVDFLGTSVSSPQLTGFIDDATATVSIDVAGTTYTDEIVVSDDSWTLPAGVITPGLTDGAFDVVATATDAFGNIGLDQTEDELVITTEIIALNASRITPTSVRANWSEGTDATSYRIDLSTDAEFSAFVSGYEDREVTATNITITGLDFGTDYFYRVRFVNTASEVSGNSNTTAFTTTVSAATQADFAALEQIFSATGGSNWSSSGGWTTEPRLQNWDFITLDASRQRVVGLTIEDNNLSGTFPVNTALSSLTNLDLSGNAIENIDPLGGFSALQSLDISENALTFGDLEPIVQLGLATLNYENQAAILFDRDVRFDEGSPIEVRHLDNYVLILTTDGSANQYQFNRNETPIATGEQFNVVNNLLEIQSIDFENMGTFTGSVTNDLVPGLSIEVAPQIVNAIADVAMRIVDSNGELLAESISGFLLETVRTSEGFDTLSVATNTNAEFTFEGAVLGNYLCAIDPSNLDDFIATYYGDEFSWELAEVIEFRKDTLLTVEMTETPRELTEVDGEGSLGVVIEEDFESNPLRVDARRRAARRKCGLRKRRTGGRTDQDDEIFDLIAYGETNDNGEFEFGFLPVGDYRFFVEYPGIPLDENAFVSFTVGEAGISDTDFKLEAFASPDGIEVSIQKVLGVILEYFKDLEVYPNPADQELNVRYRHLKSANITAQLVDLSGNIMWAEKVDAGFEGRVQIDVNDFADGMYILRFFDQQDQSQNVVTYRIIVKHR